LISLVGIILIVLSFTFWYFIVPPVVSLGTYSFSRRSVTKNISNGSSLILYFGSIRFQQQDYYNRSRPVDYSMNLTLVLGTTGPINITVYVRDAPVFSFIQSNATQHNLEFNSTKYMLFVNNQTTPPSWLHSSIYSSIPVSLGDAFTGGTTPYSIIRGLNTTQRTSVTYFYTYSAEFRDSNGITLLIFVVGAIIVIVYGIVFARRLIRRIRGS
jgi:hypothetical protein